MEWLKFYPDFKRAKKWLSVNEFPPQQATGYLLRNEDYCIVPLANARGATDK